MTDGDRTVRIVVDVFLVRHFVRPADVDLPIQCCKGFNDITAENCTYNMLNCAIQQSDELTTVTFFTVACVPDLSLWSSETFSPYS